jgi:hypothetical protein
LGRNRVIERALQVPNTTDPKLLYYIYRFLEICCQHHNTTLHFLKNNGVDALVANISKFHNQVHPSLLIEISIAYKTEWWMEWTENFFH